MSDVSMNTDQLELNLVDNITAPMKRIKASVESLKKSMADLGKITGFEQIGKSVRNLKKSVSALGKATGFDRLRSTVENFKSSVRSFDKDKSIDKIKKSVEGLKSRAENAKNTFSGFSSKIMSIGKSAYGMASTFAETGNAVAKLSKETGLGVEELQELRYAAENSGVSAESFNESMKTFSKGLADAKNGTGPLYDALKDANPELLNSALAAESTGDALALLMGSMGDVKSADFSPEFLEALLGANGSEMEAFLGLEPEKLAALRKEAKNLGVVLSEQDVGNSAKFVDTFEELDGTIKGVKTDTFTKLNAAITGVKNTVASALVPIITVLAEKLTTLLVENREKIGLWVQQFGDMLPGAIDSSVGALENIGVTVSSVIEGITTVIGVIESVIGPLDLASISLGGFAAIKLAPLISSIMQVGSSVMTLGPLFAKAITTIMGAMGPVGLAILGIGLVVAEIIAEWDNFKAYWQNAWNEISAAFDQGWLQGVWELYKKFNPLKLMIDGIDHLTEKYLGFSPKEIVGGWLTDIANYATSFYEEMKGTGAGMVQGILDGLAAAWSGLKSWFSSSITKLMPKKVLEWIGWDDSSSPDPVPDVVTGVTGKSPTLKAMEAGAAAAKPKEVDQSIDSFNLNMNVIQTSDPEAMGKKILDGAAKAIADKNRAQTARLNDI